MKFYQPLWKLAIHSVSEAASRVYTVHGRTITLFSYRECLNNVEWVMMHNICTTTDVFHALASVLYPWL